MEKNKKQVIFKLSQDDKIRFHQNAVSHSANMQSVFEAFVTELNEVCEGKCTDTQQVRVLRKIIEKGSVLCKESRSRLRL